MSSDLETIQSKIIEVMDEIKDIYLIPVDQTKLTSARIKIIELLERATFALNKKYNPLTSWQKEKIVVTINALYRDQLHRALNSIELAIADASIISPGISYENEIMELSYNDLINQISILKEFLKTSYSGE